MTFSEDVRAILPHKSQLYKSVFTSPHPIYFCEYFPWGTVKWVTSLCQKHDKAEDRYIKGFKMLPSDENVSSSKRKSKYPPGVTK